MKKRLLSLLLAVCLAASVLALPVSAAETVRFSDVTDRDTAMAVESLRLLGVLDGYGDGSFRPNAVLTRAQFCKMAVYAMDGESELGLYRTVTERTREIGVRRAIGARRSSIVTQFLIEAAMLCGIGGIIGIILGTGGTRLAGRLLVQMDIWPSVTITLGAFLLSVSLGSLFGIYPAAKASKLQPVEALRAE